MLTTNIGGGLGVLALLLCMTLFLISYNTGLVLLVMIPAMKNVSATAGLMKKTTLPEINMEYWMEYRDLILVKWVPDRGFLLVQEVSFIPSVPVALVSLPAPSSEVLSTNHFSHQPVSSPSCTTWLLRSMLLMAVNAYFSPMTPTLYL
ncbi:hypothetical protein DSO57_1006434 [Entomophthora muscae]|uniref:Uncharacterized protein n=1 Tax=Entomophthora muscae TaxID=34485 RepID=A0ACC2UHJ7_9FUNG|nr:hypothetical protein DSO57_1006434 [Entomophthora muscae]